MLGFIKKMLGLAPKTQLAEPKSPAPVPAQSDGTRVLDCKNLNCPMPIVKISKEIKTMQTGDRLLVQATDPAFRADLEAWVRKTGNVLLNFEDGEIKEALVEKAQLA